MEGAGWADSSPYWDGQRLHQRPEEELYRQGTASARRNSRKGNLRKVTKESGLGSENHRGCWGLGCLSGFPWLVLSDRMESLPGLQEGTLEPVLSPCLLVAVPSFWLCIPSSDEQIFLSKCTLICY